MRTNRQHEALKQSLDKLEMALLAPVVSGELNSWLENAQQAAGELQKSLAGFASSSERAEFKQIAQSDQELLFRIEQMAKEDQAIVAELEQFRKELRSFYESIPEAIRHESKVAEQRQHLEEKGLAVAIRIKRQLAALTTWFSESLYRDRGPVD